MADKNIQFKEVNGSGFDKLFPATKSAIVDVKGVSLDDELESISSEFSGIKSSIKPLNDDNVKNKKDIVTLTSKVTSLETLNSLLYDEI